MERNEGDLETYGEPLKGGVQEAGFACKVVHVFGWKPS